MDLTEFVEQVGSSGNVTIEGTGTRGGAVLDVRTVRAPRGIIRVDAAEMVVECGAGTPVDDVHSALAEVGQTVSMPPGGTVGGALAVGHSHITRLGHGAMRDTLLQTHYVSARGEIVVAGGGTVKNVSGFDLCRLLVGSHGTVGFLGTVLLRTRPLARHERWFASDRDPIELLREVYRPVCLLWDGETTWLRLDGNPGDISNTATRHSLVDAEGPPPLPTAHRWSLRPDDLFTLRDDDRRFIAEVGVGVVHHESPQPQRSVEPAVATLHERIAHSFDPDDRLNPGRSPLQAV